MRIPAATVTAASRTPESQLLLCCLHTHMDTTSIDRLQALLQVPLDWTHLIRVAIRNGVAPLLYWNLNTLCAQAVPPAHLEHLRSHFQRDAGRGLFLTHELRKLLQLFAAHDLPAMPYKGPALAAHLYGNIALRPFSDLDILVRPLDVLKAKALVLAAGYQPAYHLTPRQEAARLRTGYDYAFNRSAPRLHLELHWRIAPQYFYVPLDLDSLWEHQDTTWLAGTPVAIFPPPLLLVSLCVHGGKDLWSRLKWVVDIAELIRTYPALDWPGVVTLAQKLGCEHLLHLGLLLAADLLDLTLPAVITARLQANPGLHNIAAHVAQQLLYETYEPPGFLARHHFRLQLRERWQDRIRYGFHIMLDPTLADWACVSLPTPLFFLYTPFRLTRLVLKHGLRPLLTQARRLAWPAKDTVGTLPPKRGL